MKELEKFIIFESLVIIEIILINIDIDVTKPFGFVFLCLKSYFLY